MIFITKFPTNKMTLLTINALCWAYLLESRVKFMFFWNHSSLQYTPEDVFVNTPNILCVFHFQIIQDNLTIIIPIAVRIFFFFFTIGLGINSCLKIRIGIFQIKCI